MKTPQQIRNEVEKDIKQELIIGIERNKVLPLDWAMDRIKPILEKGFTEYDKAMKEMIENLDFSNIIRMNSNLGANITQDRIKELFLSKIGDNSETKGEKE